MSKPFFIVSLPRSRSCWLSTFLSYQTSSISRVCGHDLLVRCKSISEFREQVAEVDGTCETAIIEGWKIMRDLWPKSRVVVIHRDLVSIVQSCRKLGLEPNLEQLIERKEMLDMLANAPGVKSYQFEQLEDPAICKEIFEFCLKLEFDVNWWSLLQSKNIQINMPLRLQEIQSRYEDLRSLRLEVLAASSKLGNAGCLGLH